MTNFMWPVMLVALLLLPLLPWAYRRWLKPPAKAVVLHPDVALLAKAGASGRRWTRQLPAWMYLSALSLAVLALARPTMMVPEVDPKTGIILALDVSLSMQAGDVRPSRIVAARQALTAFVEDLPAGVRVGLVTFAGHATLLVPLTDDHERVLRAVDVLYLGRGTVIGSALVESARALPSLEERLGYGGDPRSYANIVLLSDGANRGGIPPVVALEEVKAQEVTVHTIGVGDSSSNADMYDPWGFGGGSMRFDETTLRLIAEETGGRFTMATSSEELSEIYRGLSRSLAWRMTRDEATAVVTLAAALLLFGSLLLAQWRRMV